MATADRLTEDYLTCIICYDVFTNPVTLQCDHTFCRPCLLKYTETQPGAIQAKCIPCPVCKQRTKVTSPGETVDQWISQLKPSRIIQGLVDDFGKDLEGDTQGKSQPFLCKIHTDMAIKQFCKDCRKAICRICYWINHRHCKTVSFKESLPEITSTILARKHMLTDRILKRTELIIKRTSSMKEIQEKSIKTATEIRSATHEVKNVIRVRENQLMEELEKIKTNQIQQLSDELNTDDKTVRGYKQQLEFIEKGEKSASQKDLYDVYESCGTELTQDIVDISPRDKITFRRVVSSEIEIGHVYSTKVGDVGRETVSALQQTIDMRSTKDTSAPDITDVVLMEMDDDKLLVVVDRSNGSIKSFYTGEDQQLVDVLRVDPDPFGITAIRKNEVVVTQPSADRIKQISVFPKLICLRTISTGRCHYGIYNRGANSLFACRFPLFGKSTVDMIDMSGNVLKSFETGTHTVPKYVCEGNHGKILASCQTSFICLSPEDEIPDKTLCPDYLALRGIATTVTGDILLVARNINSVIQITESGEIVRILLTSADGLDEPCGICIDKDGWVYVTCGQCVKVFTFR